MYMVGSFGYVGFIVWCSGARKISKPSNTTTTSTVAHVYIRAVLPLLLFVTFIIVNNKTLLAWIFPNHSSDRDNNAVDWSWQFGNNILHNHKADPHGFVPVGIVEVAESAVVVAAVAPLSTWASTLLLSGLLVSELHLRAKSRREEEKWRCDGAMMRWWSWRRRWQWQWCQCRCWYRYQRQ